VVSEKDYATLDKYVVEKLRGSAREQACQCPVLKIRYSESA